MSFPAICLPLLSFSVQSYLTCCAASLHAGLVGRIVYNMNSFLLCARAVDLIVNVRLDIVVISYIFPIHLCARYNFNSICNPIISLLSALPIPRFNQSLTHSLSKRFFLSQHNF